MSFTRAVELEDEFTIVHSSSWLGWVCVVLFGGMGCLLIGLAVAVEGPGVDRSARVVLGSLGAMLGLSGIAILTLGHMTILDRRAGSVRSGWSTLGFWWSRTWAVGAFRGVTVKGGTTATSSSGSRTARFYVHLVGMTAQRVLVVYLGEYADRAVAMELAERVGRFLSLPLFEDEPLGPA